MGAIANRAFAAFNTNTSKAAPYHDIVDGMCILMGFPFGRVLAFYFASLDNQKMTRSEFRAVLCKYAPALFAREADATAVDQLLYDLDTCSFGVSPPRFLQEIAT